MDPDEASIRIAELERQLAEAKAAAGVGQPDAFGANNAQVIANVQNVAFSRPPIGKRGYNENEVDAFLDYVVARLLNPGIGFPTAADVQNMAFSKPPMGSRGYNENEVDAFLDYLASELWRLDSGG